MLHTAQARADDGTMLNYQIRGASRPGKRLALIHSLAMDADFWSAVAEALAVDFEVLAVDCRGHGKSGKPPGPYSVERFADDLAAVLDHAGWDAATVAGASMGGCVALAFAARHPARLSGLGLVDTTAYYGPAAVEDWEARATKALENGMGALVDFQKTRWFSDTFRATHPEQVDAAIAVFVANDLDAYAETCRMLGRSDQRGVLPRIAVPVEIVVGEEDFATPVDMARKMAEATSAARMTVLESARHFTPLEVPGEVASILSRLMHRVAA